MFEVGKRYEIQTTDPLYPDSVTYHYGEVAAYVPPLLKLREHDGKEWIVNTTSPLFISAKLQLPVSGGRNLMDELIKAIETEKATQASA